MTHSSHTRGLICVITATILWSTAEVVTRTVIDSVTPIQIAAIRFSLGALMLFIALPVVMRGRRLRFNRTVILHGLWLAVIGVFISNLAMQFALKHAGAGVVAAVWGTNPLVVMGLSIFMLNDPLSRPRLIGLIAGLIGIIILALSKPSDTFSLLGLLLAVLASSSFALFAVCVKLYAGRFAGLPFTALCAAFGALYLLPVMLVEGRMETFFQPDMPWLPLLYLGIITTGLSYLLFFVGLDKVDATQASSIIMLKPPLATLLAALWLGEPITWNLVAAMLLILGGLYLVVIAQRRQGAPDPIERHAPTPS